MVLLAIIAHSIVAFAPLPVAARPAFPVPDSTLSTWQMNVAKSELTFSIGHFVVEHVTGKFTKWAGTIQADPANWNSASVSVTVQAASITTGDGDRDAHLQDSDFFDVAKFPTITFASTKVIRRGDSVTVMGHLSMHGVTKPVVLTGKMVRMKQMTTGKFEAAFEATATVDRFDYGITWEDIPGAVGRDVTIGLKVTAEQQ